MEAALVAAFLFARTPCLLADPGFNA